LGGGDRRPPRKRKKQILPSAQDPKSEFGQSFQNFSKVSSENSETGWAKKQAGSSRIMKRAFLKGFEIMSKSQGFVHINGGSTMISG